MRLAHTIVVRLGERSLELRPTLRAAMTLERAHGLETLGEKLLEINLTVIADTIAATAFGPYSAEEIAALLIRGGMAANAMRVAPELLELVEGLVGIDPDADEAPARSNDERTPIAEAQRVLFRIGTGKMGWTPAETLNATPLEIIEAWKGRLELLKDIFGSAEENKDTGGTVDQKTERLMATLAALPGATGA